LASAAIHFRVKNLQSIPWSIARQITLTSGALSFFQDIDVPEKRSLLFRVTLARFASFQKRSPRKIRVFSEI